MKRPYFLALACSFALACTTALFGADTAYVANLFTRNISVIDIATRNVTGTISLTAVPRDVVILS